MGQAPKAAGAKDPALQTSTPEAAGGGLEWKRRSHSSGHSWDTPIFQVDRGDRVAQFGHHAAVPRSPGFLRS